MRPGVWCVACAAILLGVSSAGAQPLFRGERDWTTEIGGQLYGFRDVVQTPGDFRWTQVWIAGRSFVPAHNPADWWVFALPPVAAALAERYLTAQWKRGRRP